MDGSFDDWAGAMEYLTYENDVEDRNCVGRGSNSYVNTSGRNDITRAKTAVDGKMFISMWKQPATLQA